MSFLKTSASAIGKLFIVAALAASFLVGLFGVVYLSLRGEEIKVPEVTGKDFLESEKELSQLGLRIKRRATRYSEEKPNTVLEQSPKAGETAKTGQLILVVVSQLNPESTEAPATVEKDTEEDIPTDELDDKSKKTNKNANVKKPVKTTRDGASNKPAKNSNTETGETTTKTDSSSNTAKPSSTAPAANKPSPTSPTSSPKPSPAKSPTSGETRTRRIPD